MTTNNDILAELYAIRKENRELAKMTIATVMMCANPDANKEKVMDIAARTVRTCWVK